MNLLSRFDVNERLDQIEHRMEQAWCLDKNHHSKALWIMPLQNVGRFPHGGQTRHRTGRNLADGIIDEHNVLRTAGLLGGSRGAFQRVNEVCNLAARIAGVFQTGAHDDDGAIARVGPGEHEHLAGLRFGLQYAHIVREPVRPERRSPGNGRF